MKICMNKEKLRDARIAKQMTQRCLAEHAETSERYIRALEMGTRERPTAEVLYKIAICLDTPMDELLVVVADRER